MGKSAATPKRKRRWLQFSVRTAIVLVTLFCVALGLLVNSGWKQRKAVKWVEEKGGTFEYDYEHDEDGMFIEDAEPPSVGWARKLLGVGATANVVGIDLDNKDVTDISHLTQFSNLKVLRLSWTKVRDLAPLAKLTQLERLSIDATPIDDLGPLANCAKLKELNLSGTDDTDLATLANLTDLEILFLDHSQVEDLRPLKKLSNLTHLFISNSTVSDLSPLAHLRKLKYLSAENSGISDISPLSNVTSLVRLRLCETSVQDLRPLAKNHYLDELNYSRSNVTEENYLAFLKAQAASIEQMEKELLEAEASCPGTYADTFGPDYHNPASSPQ